MVNFCVSLIKIRLEKFRKFSTVTVNVRKIKGTEILIERHVGQIIINIEEECIFDILRRLGIGDPIKFV